MRAVIQRVSSASVTIEGALTAQISRGLLVFLGIQKDDTPADVEWLAPRIANLRIFADASGKMNLSILDLSRPATAGGTLTPEAYSAASSTAPSQSSPAATARILVVSQFTLFASTRKGNRPSFNDAAAPPEAIPLYESFLRQLERIIGGAVATGTFGAMMQVALVNDGPVTLILDSKRRE